MPDNAIAEMVKSGYLHPDEVTDENRISIAKLYAQTIITCLRTIDQREKGDFYTEEPIFAQNYYTQFLDQHQKMPQVTPQAPEPKPEPSSSMLYSEALEKYCKAKVSNGNWKEHSVGDHYSQLKKFLTIIGDLPINMISRKVMRNFQDTLCRLPPRREQ